MNIQWSSSKPDNIGIEKSVLNSEVSSFQYTNVSFGTEKRVLFMEVSL